MTDHLGSVRGILGGGREALARYAYTPYGETALQAGLPLHVGFTGHLWEPQTGQYFAPFRYYSPGDGRWLTRDPLGFVDGPNVYGYVGGNPILYIDELGLQYACGNLGEYYGTHPEADPNWLDDYGNGLLDGLKVLAGVLPSLLLLPESAAVAGGVQVVRWGGPIVEGSWVMTGTGSLRNAIMAGRPLRYFTTEPTTAVVANSALKWPGGRGLLGFLDWLKGFIGQRIFCG